MANKYIEDCGPNVKDHFNDWNSLLSGENSPKQLLLINNQLVTKLIKFFD